MTFEIPAVAEQALKAFGYYCALIVILRLAGKRLAGQTTTFDLIVLITMGVVLQSTALAAGALNAAVFVVTVFGTHKLTAVLCARSTAIRHLVRGKPRVLIRDGRIVPGALEAEGISEDELCAGLRKLGHEGPADVRSATLEETGHISAVARENGAAG